MTPWSPKTTDLLQSSVLCACAVASPETMVVWMEQLILVHVLNYLDENGPFNDFAQYTEDCNRSVVFRLQGVSFLQ